MGISKRKLIILGSVVVFFVVVSSVFFLTRPASHYKNGIKLLQEKSYEEAIAEFRSADNYRDAKEQIVNAEKAISYEHGKKEQSENNYVQAIEHLTKAGDYPGAKEALYEAMLQAFNASDWEVTVHACSTLAGDETKAYEMYAQGMIHKQEEQYADAINCFEKAQTIEASKAEIVICSYELGKKYYDTGDFPSAKIQFMRAGDYSDAQEWLSQCNLQLGKISFEAGDYEEALRLFEDVKNKEERESWLSVTYFELGKDNYNEEQYKDAFSCFSRSNEADAEAWVEQAAYHAGIEEYNAENYGQAITYFASAGGYEDTTDWNNKALFMMGEYQYLRGLYDTALIYYEQLPSDYSLGEHSVSERKSAIELLEYYRGFEGMHLCDYAYREVRQTSKSYGSWYNWYNKDLEAFMYINVDLNEDGSIKVSGTITGIAYTEYSSISAGLRQKSISANFSVDVQSKKLPATLYDENNIKVTCNGNTITFKYYLYTTNEDVYFNYTYSSEYRFELNKS